MSQLHIKNGTLFDPASKLDQKTDLFISNGKIAGIGKKPKDFKAKQCIDAKGCMVCPGIVDLSARLREPGEEYKADILSESKAAASSGITTLCIPPDTVPVIDEPSVVELIDHQAANASYCNIVTLAALTVGLKGEQLSELGALKVAGCVGVTNCRNPVENTLTLKRAYSYAATFGMSVFIEPDNHWLSDNGCAHDGPIATRIGLQGIPVSAETTSIVLALELIAETKVQAHFCRLSSAKSVELIRKAKKDGLPVTADVSAHQLHLTELDISSFNSLYHVLPPLRSQRDMEALRTGVSDGTIDAICSDHQPHEPDAKKSPFASTQPGISAINTLLPLTMKLVDDGILNKTNAIAALTSNPAKILGLNVGVLANEHPADIIVLDTQSEWDFDEKAITSRGKNTPFTGWQFNSRVKTTIVSGKVVSGVTGK